MTTAALPDPQLSLPADAQPPGDSNSPPGLSPAIIVAGGCFWCIDGVFRQLKGVLDVTSGYAGGTRESADYESVCTGRTAHAEAVRVTYDPRQITYARLLQVFFTAHDPTTKNRQGNDVGPQYRSAIFPETPDQQRIAEAYINQLDAARIFPKKIATTIEPINPDAFYPAEAYHQDYAACHLSNPYIQHQSLPKIAKVRAAFKNDVKG